MSRLLLLLCFPLLLVAGKPEAAWTLEGNGDVRWHKVTATGAYLFATDAGQYLWKREDMKKVPEFAIEEVPGTPLLFVADDECKFQKSTKLMALDIMNGTTIWETEKLQGSMADLVPDYKHNAIVLFSAMPAGKANWDLQIDASGALKFTSADFGAAIPEMIFDSGTVYGRMGGVFLDPGSKQYAIKKPIGVVALDAGSGSLRWRYESAKESVTNRFLARGSNSILLADAKNQIGLSLDASGNKVKEYYKLPLEFKINSGGAKKAAKMAGLFALGGVRGLAQKDKSGEDGPIALIPRSDGQLIIRGKQHLLLFNPKTRQTGWGSAFKAPGISNFAKIATVAAFAMQYGAAMSKRYSANAVNDKFAYMLTDVETDEGKGTIVAQAVE